MQQIVLFLSIPLVYKIQNLYDSPFNMAKKRKKLPYLIASRMKFSSFLRLYGSIVTPGIWVLEPELFSD